MNTHTLHSLYKTCIAIATLTISASNLCGAEFVDTIEKSFPIAENGQLFTQLEDADISVTSHNKSEIYVLVTRKLESKSEEEAQEIFAKHIVEFQSEPDSLKITSKREDSKSKLWGFRGSRFQAKFKIFVPQKLNTNLKTVDGDVVFSNVEGTATIHTVDGDLKVSDVSGELELKTVDGDALINNMVGPLVVRSVDGDLILKNIQGSIQAKTIDGDVQIELTGQPERESNIESKDGDIELVLSEGVGLIIDAKASDGSVHLPFVAESIQKRGDTTHVVATAHGGGPQMVLRTRDGDIAAE